jgi:hypothetical protein
MLRRTTLAIALCLLLADCQGFQVNMPGSKEFNEGMQAGAREQANAAYPDVAQAKLMQNASPACTGIVIVDVGHGFKGGVAALPVAYIDVINNSDARKSVTLDVKYHWNNPGGTYKPAQQGDAWQQLGPTIIHPHETIRIIAWDDNASERMVNGIRNFIEVDVLGCGM